MDTTSKMNRHEVIDFGRVISCIAVLIIHVTADYFEVFNDGSVQYIVVRSMNLLARFAVPSFIALNGYVMYLKYGTRQINLKTYLLKGFLRLLVPYVLWTFVYVVYYHYYYSVGYTLKDLLNILLYGTASYHLYYLVIAIQFYLIMPIIMNAYKRLKRPMWLMLLLLVISVMAHKLVLWPYKDRMFWSYLLFYGLGIVIAHKKDYIASHLKMISIGVVLLFSGLTPIYLHYFLLIDSTYLWWLYSISVISLLYCLGSAVQEIKVLKLFDKSQKSLVNLSFSIYLIHPLILDLIRRNTLFISLRMSSMTIAVVVEFLVLFILSWGIAWFFDYRSMRRRQDLVKARSISES